MNQFLNQIDVFCNALNEAVESLKPQPDPRREEFPPSLPPEFRQLWEMTENWERWSAPCHFANFEVMPHEMWDIADDGTTSRTRCKERAERQLRKAYREAEQFLGSGEDGMSGYVLDHLKQYLTEQFHQVHHLLRLMAAIPGIQDELSGIRALTDFDRVEQEARVELEKAVESEHKLSDFSDYAEEIRYYDDDANMETGFLRFLEKAFVRYNFDGSEVYFKIRTDAQRGYDMYQEQVDWIIPPLLSATYSRRVREYLEEIEVKLGGGVVVVLP